MNRRPKSRSSTSPSIQQPVPDEASVPDNAVSRTIARCCDKLHRVATGLTCSIRPPRLDGQAPLQLGNRLRSSAVEASITLAEPYLLIPGTDGPDGTHSEQQTPTSSRAPPTLRGHVTLRLGRPVLINDLAVNFIGTSTIDWSFARKEPTRRYRPSKNGTQQLYQTLATDILPPSAKGLFAAGTHEFPFCVTLSRYLSESISTDHGRIEYRVESVAHVQPRYRRHTGGRSRRDRMVAAEHVVNIVRAPCPAANPGSVVPEPIMISKNWRNIVQYDLCVNARTFLFGSTVHLSLSFAPLTKFVFCHSVRIDLIERTRYANAAMLRRKEKVLRLSSLRTDAPNAEKRASIASLDPLTTVSVSGHGLISVPESDHIRHAAIAAASAAPAALIPFDCAGTHCDFAIPLPSCRPTAEPRRRRRSLSRTHSSSSSRPAPPTPTSSFHHDTSSDEIQVRHYLRVTVRVSFPASLDPDRTDAEAAAAAAAEEEERRQRRLGLTPTSLARFKLVDVMTESPIQLLSCLADPVQLALPQYSPASTWPASTVLSSSPDDGADRTENPWRHVSYFGRRESGAVCACRKRPASPDSDLPTAPTCSGLPTSSSSSSSSSSANRLSALFSQQARHILAGATAHINNHNNNNNNNNTDDGLATPARPPPPWLSRGRGGGRGTVVPVVPWPDGPPAYEGPAPPAYGCVV